MPDGSSASLYAALAKSGPFMSTAPGSHSPLMVRHRVPDHEGPKVRQITPMVRHPVLLVRHRVPTNSSSNSSIELNSMSTEQASSKSGANDQTGPDGQESKKTEHAGRPFRMRENAFSEALTVCPTCQGQFTPRRAWQRFCSAKCRTRGNKQAGSGSGPLQAKMAELERRIEALEERGR